MNLKDIARLAGVSSVTVSNVINGKHHKVSKATIEKVQKIIEENDYHPNATARSLALKESKIIAVVVPNLSEREVLSSSPYNSQMLGYLERYIRNQGYYQMTRSVQKCQEVIPIFSTWNVDGILFFGAFQDEVEGIQDKLNVPAVYIDTYPQDIPVANVGIDDYKGGYLAARYLIAKGHTRIAFAGPTKEYTPSVISERYRGFSDACKEKGIEITEESIFEANTDFQCGVEAGKKIAFSKLKFTAVVCMSDILAIGIMEGLRLCGLNIPGDVSVIGFDNLPECQYTNPQLTTVAQDLERKAELAGEYLFSMIRDKEKKTGSQKLDVEIVERHSVKSLTKGE